MKDIIKEAVIVDVRTPEEFRSGHVVGSVNIPLNELQQRLSEIRRVQKPIVLCCASGARSGKAQQFLSQQGIKDCYNGGSWLDVNYFKSNEGEE